MDYRICVTYDRGPVTVDRATGHAGMAMAEQFTQVTRLGWKAIRDLAEDPAGLRVYVFLADHCGHENALVCTYALLVSETGLSESTIRRAVRRLVDAGHLETQSIGSGVVYILNPAEVWKTAQDHKRFCSFGARALIPFGKGGVARKRLTHMLARQPEGATIQDERQVDLEDVLDG